MRSHIADLLPDRTVLRLVALLSTPAAIGTAERCLPSSDSVGFVRVNRRGRERRGSVVDRDVSGLLDEVSDGLRTFVDTDGEPCVAEILRPDRVLGDGPRTSDYPDLLVFGAINRPTGRPSFTRRVSETSPGAGVGTGRAGACDGALAQIVPGAHGISHSRGQPSIPLTCRPQSSRLLDWHADLPGSPLLVRS